jgi:hypothetical protein
VREAQLLEQFANPGAHASVRKSIPVKAAA